MLALFGNLAWLAVAFFCCFNLFIIAPKETVLVLIFWYTALIAVRNVK